MDRGNRILKNLVTYTPNRVPRSHTPYGIHRLCLKDQLESVRDNWFTGRTARVKLSIAQKRAFMQKLPWLHSYIRELREYRKKRTNNDAIRQGCRAWCTKYLRKAAKDATTTYSSISFTQDHETFKDDTSQAFAKQVKRKVSDANWIVLDDFPKKSRRDLRTLTAMKKAGLAVRKYAYMCNPGRKQIEAAERMDIKGIAQMTCEDAMQSVWKKIKFGAAYLDLCAGTVDYVMKVVDAVMMNTKRQCVLGVTITSRDKTGHTMSERIKIIRERMWRRHGFRPLVVSDTKQKKESLIRYKRNFVVTMYFSR